MIRKILPVSFSRGFRRYFKNIAWMISEQIFRIVAGVFVGIWVARYLGPEQFGIFSYALAFAAIFGIVAKLGLDAVLVRELVNHPEQRDILLGTAFWLKIFGAFIVMGLLAATVPFISHDNDVKLYVIIIAAGFIFQGFEVVYFYFQSQVQGKVISVCKMFQLGLSSIVKVFLVWIHAELICFVVVNLFDSVSLAISYAVAYRVHNKMNFYNRFNFSVAKSLLSASWSLIISSVAIIIYMKIDQVMIKNMLGPEDVGYYAAAAKLTEAWLFLTTITTSSLFPAILNAKKIDAYLYQERMVNLYRFLLLTSISLSVLTTIFSDKIILFTFGASYALSSDILCIYTWSNIFVFLNNASWQWYLAENIQKKALVRIVGGAMFNIVFNIVFIHLYGLKGAALATLVSYSIVAYWGNLFSKETVLNFKLQNRALFSLHKIIIR